MKTLNEDIACGAIMRENYRRHICLPRYTPRNWWECDVFELTKTGYFREYEVKLTLADFKLDAQKRMEKRPWAFGTPPTWENKHELLAKGDPRGPVEFFFVAPEGLIARELIPAWAGLIELHDYGEQYRPTSRWRTRLMVDAPRLHKQKADANLRPDALGCCYWRFHAALTAARDHTAAPLVWADEPAPSAEPMEVA